MLVNKKIILLLHRLHGLTVKLMDIFFKLWQNCRNNFAFLFRKILNYMIRKGRSISEWEFDLAIIWIKKLAGMSQTMHTADPLSGIRYAVFEHEV